MNNIAIISDKITKHITKIANDLWSCNTNYQLGDCADIFDNNLSEVFKRPTIAVIQSKTLETHQINDTFDIFTKYNLIPIIIKRKSRHNILDFMYDTFTELNENTLLYQLNKREKNYQEFKDIVKGYMINGNKTVRTPRKRKTSTTSE